MIDPDTVQRAVEHYRTANGYRPHLLTLYVIAHGEADSWEPLSKADVKRKLTRPRDEYPCSDRDLVDAIAQAVHQGLLDGSSTPKRLALAGGDPE